MKQQLPRVILCLAFLLAACLPARPDVLSDFVAAWSAAFAGLADANTGLTMFPLLTMPMGGRAEGMAGAYSAYGSGVEGLDYNPAASTGMAGAELFFSHRNVAADTTIDGFAAAGSAGPVGIGALAKVFLAPFTSYDASGLVLSSGYFTEAVVAGNLAVQPFSFPGNGGISAGVNVKAAARFVPQSIAPGQTALGFALDVGLLARWRMLSFSPGSPANFGLSAVMRNVGMGAVPEGYPLPTALTFGIAWAPFAPLTFDLDVDVPVSLSGGLVPVENVDGALGLEVRMSSFASVHAGFRLKGDNPRLTLGARLGFGAMSIVADYTLDLVGGVNPLTNYSVAAVLATGG